MIDLGVVEDNLDAIQSATYRAAKVNKMDDKIGSLEIGKEADLIIVDGKPDKNIDDLSKVNRNFNGKIKNYIPFFFLFLIFFQILIGIGIFLLFLVFRGLISKLIIKKLEIISKRTTNKLDDTFVQSLIGPARFFTIVLVELKDRKSVV